MVLEEWIRGINSGAGDDGGVKNKWSRYILVFLIGLGVLALIWPMGKAQPVQVTEKSASGSVERSQQKISRELEDILSQIKGAGKVRVSISLYSDGVKNYANNNKNDVRETVEHDSNGGQRNIREENLNSEIAVSGGAALLVEEKAAQIMGVLIVAEGAGDPAIKEELSDAAAALLNLSPHQIRVLPRKEE